MSPNRYDFKQKDRKRFPIFAQTEGRKTNKHTNKQQTNTYDKYNEVSQNMSNRGMHTFQKSTK